MLFTTGQERNRRFEICKACKYFKEETQSCGTILRPRTLRNGVYLCGCHMPTKTRFKAAKCGAGHWDAQITDEELQEMQQLGELKGNVSREQAKAIIDTYNRVTGSNEKYTSCPSCLHLIQQRLLKMTTHDHEKEVKERSQLVANQKKPKKGLEN